MIRLFVKLIILGLAIYVGNLLWQTHLKSYFDFDGVNTSSHASADVAADLETQIYEGNTQ